MKLKKGIISFSIIGILLVGGITLSYAGNDSSDNKVEQSYNQLIEADGIEYVKSTLDTGYSLEMYRDISNGLDQVDYYDPTGLLVTRNISTDWGATFTAIGIDNSEEGITYLGSKTVLPKDLIEENKEITSKSIIEIYFTEDVKSGLDINWNQNYSNDKTDLITYSSKDGNVYIDSNSGNLAKREIVVNEKIEQTIEYDIINRNSKNADDLFKINSPLSTTKSRDAINFDNIEIKESILENDPDYPRGVNAVG